MAKAGDACDEYLEPQQQSKLRFARRPRAGCEIGRITQLLPPKGG